MFDTKLKLRYLLSDLKIFDTKKSGLVRTQRTTHKLILVDPVEDEDSSTDWSSKRLTIRSKEMEEY